ncbi:hypothetical protein IFM89_010929 [Coptis chinensis]|uniref:S-protein homolog n=1 Tax=Coptis chinensis TaxID=261450 RepID=A0A835IMV9_9MAGN|nr:hypothetical protein IFM89_010929 [Coptis chinensis]
MLVDNELYPGTPMSLHCKSGSKDLGLQILNYQESFYWDFYDGRLWVTKLYWCSMRWRDGKGRYNSNSFVIYDQDKRYSEPMYRCDECRWTARGDGIYYFWDGKYVRAYQWNITA